MMFRFPGLVFLVTAALSVADSAADQAAEPPEHFLPLVRIDGGNSPEVVNGLRTSSFPTVVAIIEPVSGDGLCTGTLIGCETVLTAASCVCSSVGANCQAGGPDLMDPSEITVFAQHAGPLGVSSIEVPADYDLGVAADVAILKLSTPVTGIAPSAINTLMSPAVGTTGEIVGFGETQADEADNGIKRFGQVTTSTCTQVPGGTHVCWSLEEPLGDPGTDSGSCNGDAGGPLLVDLGEGTVVAGVTSGGFNPTCLPDVEVFDSDVFVNRAWIQTTAGTDLSNQVCGEISQAGTSGAPIASGEGILNSFDRHHTWVTGVPPATETLRVTLNGEDGDGNDFDLYVREGAPPTIQDWDCGSSLDGTQEFCEFSSPDPGRWYFLASWWSGAGLYQLTITSLGPEELIFSDGFETTDSRRWSATEPPPTP